ncbi:hypothetical protein DNU06_10585 [Putridiphycobacter roseus]|uniref:PPM-type phosphatase domain-containing protein n=1 Tax=Putridiphycobacter roseus TaxID=2219161 RepID=A0A2W1N196_9FLAO|nr:SpoIIE family protein phosphatase [Putridiphycobacter roseus]PZE16701.1 hypothetical protein DNU06_10585 [Putridiphycobacter roseus]
MAKLLLTFISIVLFTLSFGQDYYPPIENYSTNTYGQFRNPENYAIVQDQRGVMYFGNSNGVMEYDGKNWNFIAVQISAYVHSLCMDSTGTIYTGSLGQFGYLKTDDKGSLVYESLSDKLNIFTQQFSEVNFCFASKTHVFFQAEEGVFVYDLAAKKITVFKSENSFHTAFMVDGVFYTRERGVGLRRYINGSLELVSGSEMFKYEPCFGLFTLPNSENGLLIFTVENGIYQIKDDKLSRVPKSSAHLKGVKNFGTKLLSDGNYGIQTFDKGVFIVNAKGEIVNEINRSTGLRSNDIKSMFEDRDQNLWLGLGNGISKVNYYSPLSFFNEKAGIEGNIQAFERFQGIMYVGSSYGVYVQDTSLNNAKEFKRISEIRDQVWDFEIINNRLCIASTEGIYQMDAKQHFTKISDLNTNGILYDTQRKLIITSGNTGVYLWNNRFKLKWKDEVSLNSTTSIVKSPKSDDYWIGTSGSGALRLIMSEKDTLLDLFTFADGLCEGEVTRPILLKDSLLFGCKFGPMTFLDEDFMRELMKDELTEEELADPKFVRGMFDIAPLYDSIFDQEILLIADTEDRTWYVAEHKLGFYDKKQKIFINKPFWGIKYGRINNLLVEDNGVLWIGCADGLIRYKHNARKNYQSNFTSLIRNVLVEDTIRVFNGKFKAGVQTDMLRFDYENNDFLFSYSCPYFEDEHKPKYSTFLEGYDENWSEYEAKSDRTITNLKEGDYTFKVRAKNIYDQLSSVASYTFSVRPPWYRTAWAYFLYVILFFLVLFGVGRITSARLKRRNDQLEIIVDERTKEISMKNEVLEVKNVEISEQKKEIEDSINYAKRIQDAILPLEGEMKKWLPKSFILYRPKDIVSGDFYWFSKKGKELIVVCADCTGHGVPGAFMSMIGSDRLNIIVNERKITSPGLILAELNRAIKNTLKQSAQGNSTRDGMDAAICTINTETNELTYAGAHRGLWIVEEEAFREIKATKTAIAGFTPDEQIYEEHKMAVAPGMKFYLTTDGYADQFGGPRSKKYMVKKFKQFIMKISHKEHDAQQEALEKELLNWMEQADKKHDQVDDVCIVAFEL